MNVLFIDRSVPDFQVFVDSVNANTIPIVYDRQSTPDWTLPTSVERIGIVFIEGPSQLFGPDNTFLTGLIQQHAVKYIDFLACNTLPLWQSYYDQLMQQTGVVVGASNNRTGNIKHGGDWILESTSEDIETIYFNQSIEYYSYVLDISIKTFYIDNSKNLFYGGYNTNGYASAILTDVIAVSSGDFHTLAIKSNGDLWGFGTNRAGQLGNGTSQSDSFVYLNISSVVAVSCGYNHSVILKSNGEVWGAGTNGNGELGTATGTSSFVYLNINEVSQISCGRNHSIFLKTNGRVYGTGAYISSSNIVLFNLTNVVSIASGYHSYIAITSSGDVYGGGQNYNSAMGYFGATYEFISLNIGSAKRVAFGAAHSLILKTNGEVWASGTIVFGGDSTRPYGNNNAGYSEYTKLNVTTTNTVVQIAATVSNSYLLDNTGAMYGAGSNFYGQLQGDGANYRLMKSSVYSLSDIYRLTYGSINTSTGPNNTPLVVTGTNLFHTKTVTVNGISCSFTKTATTVSFTAPVSSGSVSIVLTDTYSETISTTFTYANPSFSSINTSTGPNNTPLVVTGTNLSNTTTVTVNGISCSFTPSDTTVSFTAPVSSGSVSIVLTDNLSNTLSIPFTYFNPVYSDMDLSSYTQLLKQDRTLWSTGKNLVGSLGINNLISTSVFTQTNMTDIVSISCRINHGLLLKKDGTVWACGNNNDGQLGLNNLTNVSVYTQTNMTNVVSISCGAYHSIVLKKDGTVWCCGNNKCGQLGLNNQTSTSVFSQTNMTDAFSISGGAYHTVVLKKDGTVWSCGYNYYGQTGIPSSVSLYTEFRQTSISDVTTITCGTYHTLAIKTDGTLWGCGYNAYKQLGISQGSSLSIFYSTGLSQVKSIASGHSHSIALLSDGTVWSTGKNDYGQLGLNNNVDTLIFTKTNLSNVVDIITGQLHTIALKTDSSVWVTGYNLEGQLGLNNQINQNGFIQSTTGGMCVSEKYALYITPIIDSLGKLYALGNNMNGQSGTNTTNFLTEFTSIDTSVTSVGTTRYGMMYLLLWIQPIWRTGHYERQCSRVYPKRQARFGDK